MVSNKWYETPNNSRRSTKMKMNQNGDNIPGWNQASDGLNFESFRGLGYDVILVLNKRDRRDRRNWYPIALARLD